MASLASIGAVGILIIRRPRKFRSKLTVTRQVKVVGLEVLRYRKNE